MQVLAAICVSLAATSHGADMAITSAAIFAFQKDLDDKEFLKSNILQINEQLEYLS